MRYVKAKSITELLGRFLREECRSCPYYRADDEYGVVRHQM